MHDVLGSDKESAMEDINKFKELNDDNLLFLVKSFYIEELPRGMTPNVLKTCSQVAIEIIDQLRPRYVEAKKDINRLHSLDFKKARCLFNLKKFDDSKSLLNTVAKEKPFGPYIFDVKFLLGAIASKQDDYETVAKIYAGLKALSQRMPLDLNREVRISVEWASAYEESNEEKLMKTGRGLALMTKDTNTEELDQTGIYQVQKAWYLYILYSKKMKVPGEEIKKLKNEFLQKFPSSRYRSKVQNL